MIIHRAMMSLIGYVTCLYSIAQMPYNIVVPILLLLPFMIGVVAAIQSYEDEMLTLRQFILSFISYLSVVIFVNPSVMQKNLDSDLLRDMIVECQPYAFQIVVCLISGVFTTMKFLATRRIGKMVHPSAKTVYLGLICLITSTFVLIIFKPEYFVFWRAHYTLKQIGILIFDGFFFWLTQFALSLCLENFKAANLGSFLGISVVFSYYAS